MTWVAFAGRVLEEEPVGPMGYVLPLAEHEATRVSEVGWTLGSVCVTGWRGGRLR